MREEAESQRRRAEVREQEVFTAQYQNVGLQEAIDKLRQHLKAAEDERDTLKTNLKEEEIARIAAEGKIPLPVSQQQDEFSSPRKSIRQSHRDSFKENEDPMNIMESDEEEEASFETTLAIERKLRQRAEEQIEFMKMECQFRCCSCRIAEGQGKEYVHDNSLEQQVSAHTNAMIRGVNSETPEPAPARSVLGEADPIPSRPFASQASPEPVFRPTTPVESPATVSTPKFPTNGLSSASPSSATPKQQEPDTLIQFSPKSGTFFTAPAAVESSSPIPETSLNHDIPQTPTALLRFSPQYPLSIKSSAVPQVSPPGIAPDQRYPMTPRPLPIPPFHANHITQTITTTVPLAIPPSPFTPSSTMTREEALEQIRQRRGRARSIAAGHSTPRKQMVDLSGLRRDISAPAGRGV